MEGNTKKIEYMTKQEINDFLEKHSGKKMTFLSYYKFRFLYEFLDENGQRYILECGDTSGDIYRDSWCREEQIRPMVGFLHGIYKK